MPRLHGRPTSTGWKAHADLKGLATPSMHGREGIEREMKAVVRVIREVEGRRAADCVIPCGFRLRCVAARLRGTGIHAECTDHLLAGGAL